MGSETKAPTVVRYNKKNARLEQGRSEGRPLFSVQTTGSFRVNLPLMHLLGAVPGDGVELLHVPKGEEWYIAKAARDGMRLNKSKQSSCAFGSMIVYRRMLPAMNDEVKGSYLVASEPVVVDGVKCYAILFSSGK